MSKLLTVIRKLVGAWPRTAADFHERSGAYAEAEQYEAAIDDLSQALRLRAEKSGGEPDESDAFYFLFCRSELYLSMKEFAKARADYDEAIDKYGDDYGALDEERAACQVELGEFESVLKVFDSQDYDEPGPYIQLMRARCFAALGRVGDAHEA